MRHGFLLIALLCGMVGGWTEDKIEVNLKDGTALKAGDVLKHIQAIEATVQSAEIVTRVDFQVDGRLRETDRSTPYEFEWDTIPEAEGEHTLTIIAYLENEKNIRLELKIQVNNEVDKGPEYHYEQAQEAFRDSKFDEAILEARIALKARSEYKPARLLLIRSYLSTSRWSDAEDAVEDLVRVFPDDPEGYMLRAQTLLRKARTSREERKELNSAIEARQKALELQDAAIKAGPDGGLTANLYKRGEYAFIRGDYDTAAQLFLTCAGKAENKVLYLNRLGQAYLRARRYSDAIVAANAAIRRDIADDYTYTILALANTRLGRDRDAETAFRKATEKNKESIYVRIAQAYLSMRDGKFQTALRQLTEITNLGHASPEVSFLRMWAYASLREFDRAREAFWLALNQEPLLAEAYTLRGFENLVEAFRPGAWEEMLPLAREMFDLALKTHPNYAPALLGHALSHSLALFFAKRDQETPPENAAQQAAHRLGEMLKVAGDEAWVHVGAALIYEQLGRGAEADRAIARANQLDKTHVDTLRVPTPERGIEMIWRLMFAPLLPNP